MNAPLPAKAVVAPERDDTSMVSPQRLDAAVEHLWNAITSLRATKTSIGRTRHQLPLCATDDELQLLFPKLNEVERAALKLVRRLERRVEERQVQR